MNLLNATELRVNGNRLTVPEGQAETVLRHLGVNLNSVNIEIVEVAGKVTATVVPRESGTKGCTDYEACTCEEDEENETVELDENLILSQRPANFIMVENILFPASFTLVECEKMIAGGFRGLTPGEFSGYTVGDWGALLDHYKYANLAALLGPNHTPETAKAVLIEISSLLK